MPRKNCGFGCISGDNFSDDTTCLKVKPKSFPFTLRKTMLCSRKKDCRGLNPAISNALSKKKCALLLSFVRTRSTFLSKYNINISEIRNLPTIIHHTGMPTAFQCEYTGHSRFVLEARKRRNGVVVRLENEHQSRRQLQTSLPNAASTSKRSPGNVYGSMSGFNRPWYCPGAPRAENNTHICSSYVAVLGEVELHFLQHSVVGVQTKPAHSTVVMLPNVSAMKPQTNLQQHPCC